MCLRVFQKRPYISDKDITCYKVVYDTANIFKMKSLYCEFFYELGKVYNTEFGFRNYLIYEGFHSFKNYADAVDSYYNHNGSMIVECTIPKGSKYYDGFESFTTVPGFVSNQLIMNKVVDDMQALRSLKHTRYISTIRRL